MPTLFDWWHYRPLPPTATLAGSECKAPSCAPRGVSYAAMRLIALTPKPPNERPNRLAHGGRVGSSPVPRDAPYGGP